MMRIAKLKAGKNFGQPWANASTKILYQCIQPCPIAQVCRCEPHLSRYHDPITGHSWCIEECPAKECPAGEVWNECGTCSELECCQGDHCGNDDTFCSTVCQPRCECGEGLVRNEVWECVAPETCFPAEDTLNAQICKANQPDYFMKSNRGKVSRESDKSAVVRVTVAKVNENKPYTGLMAFSKKACGRDFLDAIVDGRISMDLVDQEKKYTIGGSYLADNTKHTNVVIQYEASNACKGNTCLGSKTQDQFDLLLMGLETVDMGTKVMNDCLASVRAGHYGAKDDYSVAPDDFELGCVAWTNKYN